MSRKEPKVLEFEFQMIQLDEVRKILPISKMSRYYEIKEQIIERINKLSVDQTFIFGPTKGSALLNDGEKKSFMNSINGSFREEKMPWHLVYSTKAVAFVVAPYTRKGIRKPYTRRGVESGRVEEVMEFAQKVLGVTAEQLRFKNTGGGRRAKVLPITDLKRAILFYGRHEKGLMLSEMGRYLGLSSATCTAYAKDAARLPGSKQKLALLMQAHSNGGSSK